MQNHAPRHRPSISLFPTGHNQMTLPSPLTLQASKNSIYNVLYLS